MFPLTLNQAQITVEGRRHGSVISAALQSPPTHNRPASAEIISGALTMFGYLPDDLDPRLPPALIHAGADHLLVGLKTRQALARMHYDLDRGREFMRRLGLATVMLVYAEAPQQFHTRNPFASGGVYEDPATGAGAAALAGYLRDLGWPHGGRISVRQGEDMGMPSRLLAEFSDVPGSSVRVSGDARVMSA